MKPIINHLFETHRTRIEALSSRPQLRQLIFGLTVRWQQNNEPPPPPVQPDVPDPRKPYSMAAESQQEDYFNASDEEDEGLIGPKQPSDSGTVSPQKRKRVPVSPGQSPQKRPSAPSPSKMLRRKNESVSSRSPTTQRKANRERSRSGVSNVGLVDYEDGSDSDGSAGNQSPLPRSASIADLSDEQGGSPVSDKKQDPELDLGSEKEKERLEDGLGDVAMQMRAKRLREQEEEEGFVSLKPKRNVKGEEEEVKPKEKIAEGEVKKEDQKKNEKRIRLSFGPLKKLSGMGSSSGASAGK